MGQNFPWRADGRAGHDGQDGQDGRHGGVSQSGMDGTSATAPTGGEPGGGVLIQLATGAADDTIPWDVVRVNGRRHAGDARPEWGAPHGEALPIADLGEVVGSARGGDGGNGGNGGQGGDGGAGIHGQDATTHQAGGDGGPGGRGGDGGRGSSGAPGGSGGHIHIAIDARDLFLLMAVNGADQPAWLVAGGRGGGPGCHGGAGAGGPGGAGGNPNSRTEYRQVTKWRRGNDGSNESYTVSEAYTVPVPGGSRGPNGMSGSMPAAGISIGRAGKPGTFTISVRETDGTVTKHEDVARYDVGIAGFDCVETDKAHRDGVVEFGDSLEVSGLRVVNRGGMATPAHQPGRLRIEPNDWVLPADECVLLGDSLSPGQEAVARGALHLTVAPLEAAGPGDPLAIPVQLTAIGDQLGPVAPSMTPDDSPFHRPYGHGRHTVNLTARYPVANEGGVEVERSLPRGAMADWTIALHNISSQDIGVASDRNRPVTVLVEAVGGDADFSDVRAEDSESGPVELFGESWHGASGLLRPVPFIAASGQAEATLRLGFGQETPPQAGARFRASVWLGAVEQPDAWRKVQIREWTIRCRPGRDLTTASDVVLVSSDGTTRAEYDRWRELFRSMGLACDDWSVNETGHLLFAEPDDDVRERLRDTLVVVLNSRFHPGRTEKTVLPAHCLDWEQVRSTAVEYGCGVLLIGDEGYSAAEVVAPTTTVVREGDRFDDVQELTTALVTRESVALIPFQRDYTARVETTPVTVLSWPFFRPSKKALEKVARRTLGELSDGQPNKRFVVVRRPARDIERAGHLLGFIPRWTIGEIEVRRMPDRDRSATFSLAVTGGESRKESFIEGSRVHFGLLVALPFDRKLAALQRLLRGDGPFTTVAASRARLVVAALMVDLAREQAHLRRLASRAPELRTSGDFAVALPHLHALTALSAGSLFGPVAPSPTAGQWDVVLDLFARLGSLNEAQTRWWHWWGHNRRVSRFVLQRLAAWRLDVIASAVHDTEGGTALDLPAAEGRVEERLEELEAELKAHRKARRADGHRQGASESATDFFVHQQARAHRLGRDADAMQAGKDRLWTPDTLRQWETAARRRRTALAEIRRLHAGD